MPDIKTEEQHLTYLHEVSKLSLWVAATVKNRKPQEDFLWILDERTPLFSNTDFNKKHIFDRENFDTPEWISMKKQLRALYEEDNDPDNFEKKGFELLKPYYKERLERDYKDFTDYADSDEEESWAVYDLKQKGTYMELHMENAKYPNSFMSDKEYFFRILKKAVDDAEKAGYVGIYSGSWLNEYKTWLDLMPPEWKDNTGYIKEEIEWHLGFWGQFLRSNDEFNYKNAQFLRDKGRVKYREVFCKAKIDDFRRWLKEKL